jgi:Nif11 domain
MDEQAIVQFIERVQSDDELRKKVEEAEKAASENMRRDADVITKLAADEGFDISGWTKRPDRPLYTPSDAERSDSCTWTCCLAFTSTL